MQYVIKEAKSYVKDLYPITIIKDRYNGIWSGGKWTCWHLEHKEVPRAIMEDDCTARDDFWYDIDCDYFLIGKGDTSQEALDNLKEKIIDFACWLEINGEFDRNILYSLEDKKLQSKIFAYNTRKKNKNGNS